MSSSRPSSLSVKGIVPGAVPGVVGSTKNDAISAVAGDAILVSRCIAGTSGTGEVLKSLYLYSLVYIYSSFYRLKDTLYHLLPISLSIGFRGI